MPCISKKCAVEDTWYGLPAVPLPTQTTAWGAAPVGINPSVFTWGPAGVKTPPSAVTVGLVVISGAAVVSGEEVDGAAVVSGSEVDTSVEVSRSVVVSAPVVVSCCVDAAKEPSVTRVGEVVVPSAFANIVNSPVDVSNSVAVSSMAINLNVICLFNGIPPRG